MTALDARRYLLYRLDIGFNHDRLLPLSGHSCWIIAGSISRRDVVFDELLLQLGLLLPLSSYFFLTEVFITVICISVKVYRGPLSWQHVALLRWSNNNLLCGILYYYFWHVLSERRGLLVRVKSRVCTWGCVICTRVWIGVVEGLSWIQDLAKALLNRLHQVTYQRYLDLRLWCGRLGYLLSSWNNRGVSYQGQVRIR